MTSTSNKFPDRWPALIYSEWLATYETLHMWTQIVGKVKLALSPHENHWWHVALYVTPRGLTTGTIPYGSMTFEIEFDFIEHQLQMVNSDGAAAAIVLEPKSVAKFYSEFMRALRDIGIEAVLDTMPKEVPNPIPFEHDETHASYDRNAVENFRRILVQVDRLFRIFHGKFCGKSSPVHFFWGSFDLAVTRFSGKIITTKSASGKEEKVDEEFSLGFWPGNSKYPNAAFYAYALPANPGIYSNGIRPGEAHFDAMLGEFILDYEHLRSAPDQDSVLLEFAQSTYEATANTGTWDRSSLEREILEPIPAPL